jgi:perosamine synthetase
MNETKPNTFYFLRGRAALYALLQGLGVTRGDEVLLQAFTCLAVPSPIVVLGAKPVYIDIDPRSFNLDAAKLRAAISGRSKAIIVQHTFGVPADMDAIMSLAREHNLAVIEDCCHCLGSKYQGKDLGTLGDAAFYSYEWGKPIVIGLGGTAVIQSNGLREEVQRLYAAVRPSPFWQTVIIHFQYLAYRALVRPALFWYIRDLYRYFSSKGLLVGSFLPEEFEGKPADDYRTRMAGSLRRRLARKLKDVDGIISSRRLLAEEYEHGLRQLGLQCVIPPPGAEPVYLRYPILVKDKPQVLEQARGNRVALGNWYASPVHPLNDDQLKLVGYAKGSCPVAEDVSSHIVTLPLSPETGRSDFPRTLEFLSRMRDRGCL